MARLKISLFCALLMLTTFASYAVDTHSKVWTSVTFTGPLAPKSKVLYYIQPDLRFIDDKYKFSQALLWVGLGYEISPTVIVYAGDTPVTTRNTAGEYSHTNILWQQINSTLAKIYETKLLSRLRLEETKNLEYAAWSIELRERLLAKIPIKNTNKYFVILSEEPFINLKHPAWTNSDSFISQNRAFIGIGKQISKSTFVSVGYMNQFEFKTSDVMNNILSVNVDVFTG